MATKHFKDYSVYQLNIQTRENIGDEYLLIKLADTFSLSVSGDWEKKAHIVQVEPETNTTLLGCCLSIRIYGLKIGQAICLIKSMTRSLSQSKKKSRDVAVAP